MSTHMIGFQSFSRFFAWFCIGQISLHQQLHLQLFKYSVNLCFIPKFFSTYDLSRRHRSSRSPNMNGLKFNPSTMRRLLSSKAGDAQRCKEFWKPSKPYHVGIHWKALTKYSQMSTHMIGFQSVSSFFAWFCIGQISMHQQHIKGKRWILYQNSIYNCSSNIWWIYVSFQKYFQKYDLSRRHWSSRSPSMNGLKFNPSTMNTEHGRGEGLTCLGARCKPGLNWPL